MKHLEIKLPLDKNSISSISFNDVEGIYILYTADSGRDLLDNVEDLIQGSHECEPLQRLFSIYGLMNLNLDTLKSNVNAALVDNELNILYKDYEKELLNTDIKHLVTEISELNKIVKVKRSGYKTLGDVLDSYSSLKKASDSNPYIVGRDIQLQLNANITHYKYVDYYFCNKKDLEKCLIPKYIPTTTKLPVLETCSKGTHIYESLREATKTLHISRANLSRAILDGGELIRGGSILTNLYLIKE